MADTTAGVSLASLRPRLEVYYTAISARRTHLIEYGDDDDPAQFADSHTTIHLPSQVSLFPQRRHNEEWYKVALTHRAGHYERGSFSFCWSRQAHHFADRLLPDDPTLDRHPAETDLEVVFQMFTYRSLAMDLFTVLEAVRLDEWTRHRYPGLRGALTRVQSQELSVRPSITSLSPRNVIAELLVRQSLGERVLPRLAPGLHQPARWQRTVVSRLCSPSSTVEDTVEATLRVYSLIVGLPALSAKRAPSALTVNHSPLGNDKEGPWIRDWPQAARVSLEGDAVLEVPITPVRYRGGMGLRYSSYRGTPPPGRAEIYRMTAAKAGETSPAAELLAVREDGVAGPPEPLPHEHHEYGTVHFHPVNGPLSPRSGREAVYPEWDHLEQRYLQRWCRVRERVLSTQGSGVSIEDVVRTYQAVVPQLSSLLGRLLPEGLRPVRRLPDGDEIDFEAALDALVDLRTGIAPQEGVYIRRDRVARDIGFGFLIDLSSSTAERLVSDGDHVNAPALARLHGRPYRRIIDVIKEAVALLVAASEIAGDAYGLYGFSGTGRDHVDFVVIKELEEQFSHDVGDRIANMRPLHTTRMGTAVRHATVKLAAGRMHTKFLVVVSDGRPFDLDYGQRHGDGAEVEYAMQDTRQAMLEARGVGVHPCLLTVDERGQDYLRDLRGEIDYEVLARAEQLPMAMLGLYHDMLRVSTAGG